MAVSFEQYKLLRSLGIPPVHIREKTQGTHNTSPNMSVQSLSTLVIAIVSFVVLNALVADIITNKGVWIVSPSGETTIELPHWTAIRVVRKHGWHFAIVEPVKPVKNVTRWSALKILIGRRRR